MTVRRRNRRILVALAGLAVGLWLVLVVATSLAPLLAWLVGWSVATFAAYGVDKAQAGRAGWRIPELGLHALALAGGAAGGWLGMLVFRHKIRHHVFAVVLTLASVIQVALLLVALG